MSLIDTTHVKTYEDGSMMVAISLDHRAEFTQLIQRGSNLNPDASPWMKELADLVTSGEVKQDYYAQANVKRPAE